jgi:cellulose synthase (UDP-forming)
MIELLAERIHVLDPTRPVFSCMEHVYYQTPGELAAFHDGAPSVDVMGVNSYYGEQISKLHQIWYQFDSLRPYLVSEFGPRGYWEDLYNTFTPDGSLIEQSDSAKAQWYKFQWKNYVIGHKGSNIGGYAYCWHDRMEGSYTWFGLTDHLGRPKPSYYALKSLWTKEKNDLLPTYKIEGPLHYLRGKEYRFKAVSPSAHKKDLAYEWLLLKDQEWYMVRAKYMEKVGNVTKSGDGHSVFVKIPEEGSRFRLYLFVTDQQKNVTTASVAIKVD